MMASRAGPYLTLAPAQTVLTFSLTVARCSFSRSPPPDATIQAQLVELAEHIELMVGLGVTAVWLC